VKGTAAPGTWSRTGWENAILRLGWEFNVPQARLKIAGFMC
jgi:hypothetical protein